MLNPKIRKFIKFLVIGFINTLFSYIIFFFGILYGLHYSLATLIALILGILFNFYTYGNFVYNNNNTRLITHFFVIYGIIYIINISIQTLLHLIGIKNDYITGGLTILPLAVLSYILMNNYVFKKKNI